MQEVRVLGDNVKACDWALSARIVGVDLAVTNGCFDVLHAGHVDYLLAAKELAMARNCLLLVAINSDDSVRRLKGEGRPIHTLEQRMRVLAALRYVDALVPFDEDTPEKLIEQLKPRLLLKGKDYEGKLVVGADFVKANGGEVILVPFTEGLSTSRIIQTTNQIAK